MSATFPHWAGRFARQRRTLQLLFLAGFVLLPLFDLFRFDFETNRLHLFRQEIWLDEWAILWLALMFGMWLIGAISLVFGRVYCAYACPQMVFTELANDVDALAKRLTRGLAPGRRGAAARSVSLAVVGAGSVLASVLFMGYFSPLPSAVRRLGALDVGPWVGLVGASTTLLVFLDLAFVRERFCRSVCPYGLLQGVIEDGRSLHVTLDERLGECIDCAACARACPMAIDIRDGAFQIECTRCGGCIDACDAVLGRLKPARASVLRFDFGRFSLRDWDAKRLLVGLATAGFAVALAVAVATRERVSLQLSPLYTGGEGPSAASSEPAESRFLLRAANRGRQPVTLAVRAEGLPPGTTVAGLDDGVLPAGQERKFTLVVRVPRAEVAAGVTPFSWVFDAADVERRFPASFFAKEPS
jgi:polyferredoxin